MYCTQAPPHTVHMLDNGLYTRALARSPVLPVSLPWCVADTLPQSILPPYDWMARIDGIAVGRFAWFSCLFAFKLGLMLFVCVCVCVCVRVLYLHLEGSSSIWMPIVVGIEDATRSTDQEKSLQNNRAQNGWIFAYKCKANRSTPILVIGHTKLCYSVAQYVFVSIRHGESLTCRTLNAATNKHMRPISSWVVSAKNPYAYTQTLTAVGIAYAYTTTPDTQTSHILHKHHARGVNPHTLPVGAVAFWGFGDLCLRLVQSIKCSISHHRHIVTTHEEQMHACRMLHQDTQSQFAENGTEYLCGDRMYLMNGWYKIRSECDAGANM